MSTTYQEHEPAPAPVCIGCHRPPSQIPEYLIAADEFEEDTGTPITPEEFVRTEEGTYNPANGHFACTGCYIKMGEPSSPYGWRAP
jgi:hypothetical protein